MAWEEVELQSVSEFIRNGKSIKQKKDANGIPITRIETISNRTIDIGKLGYANIEDALIYQDYLLREGDILMSHINSLKHLGKTAICHSNKNIIHGMNLLMVRSNKNKIDATFLFRYFNSLKFRTQILSISNQSVNQCSFSVGKLKKLKIPLPPLPVQKKIAAILDAADNYRQKTKALIEKYDQLTQSIFLDMFGDPVRNNKGWEVKKLDEITCKITDGEHGTVKRFDTGVPYLMARNVGEESLLLNEVSYTSPEAHNKIYKRCNPEFGDLLLVCVGATIGRCCLVPKTEEFSLARSVALIKPNYDVLKSEFLLRQFKNPHFVHQILSRRNTSAQAGLYLGQISRLKLIVPPLNLQETYSEKINSISSQRKSLEKSITQSENLFLALIQKAFKGELVN